MKSPHCPDNDRLAAYLKGALPEPEAVALEEHLSQCETCETALRTLDDLGEKLFSAFCEGEVECESFVSEPQFHQAVEAIRKLPEVEKAPAEELPQDRVGPQPMSPRTLGEYEILDRLASGSMGVVFKAFHARLNRMVAIKMLAEGRHGDAAANFRFDREMRAVGSLDHPSIVRALDAREIDGRRILVMEFVEGMDLAKLVRRCGPLPISDACELIRQAALGLQVAHERGLVHRDIKPSNLMLTPQGRVKVLDLGLALFQAQPPTETEMTASGQAVGTAEYMAPEQVSDSHQIDIRADIYGLGCTLYKLLAGRTPFDAPQYRTSIEKMAAHLRDPVPPIGLERKDVPEALANVLDKMLAKSPAQRYATPGEVAAALFPFCASYDLPALLTQAQRIAADMAAGVNTAEICSSAMESTGGKKRTDQEQDAVELAEPVALAQLRPKPRRRWPQVLLSLLATAALAFLTIFLIRTRSGTVAIDIDPPGAEVSIDDGKITLVVPNVKEPIEMRLTPGEHTFEVRHGGFATKTGSFTLDAGRRQVLAVKLQESPSPANTIADSQSLVRRPVAGSPVGALGKWKLLPGAPLPAVAPFDAAVAKRHQEDWARHLGVPLELANSIGMKLMLVPPGEFTMGSPKELIEEELKTPNIESWYKDFLPYETPQHRVRITRPFYLGVYLVTQEEYQRVMGANPSMFAATGWHRDIVEGQDTKRFPVDNVSWNDAVEFCRRLSLLPEEKMAGRRYGLPTEAQWEFACRAGSEGRFGLSSGRSGLSRETEEREMFAYAWFGGYRTHTVGGKRANAWGLYDMHGNIWEWCQDWYGKDYYANSTADDPAGPSGGTTRVLRGGCWWGRAPGYCRSALRISGGPAGRRDILGLRVFADLIVTKYTARGLK